MAELDEVATLTVQGETTGVDQVITKLDAISAAQTRVGETAEASATVQETAATRSLSAAAAYDRLRASIDSSYQSQLQFGKGANTLDQAFSQGIINEEQYAQRMEELHAKYGAVVQDAGAVGGSVGWLSGIFSQHEAEVGRTNETLKATRETLHTVDPAVKEMGASLGSLTMFTGAARGGLLLLTTAITGAFLAALESAGDRALVAGQRLGTLMGSTSAANSVIEQLSTISKSTGISVDTLEGAFEKLSTAASSSTIILKSAPGVDVENFRMGTLAVSQQVAAMQSFAESLSIGRADAKQSQEAFTALYDAIQKGGNISQQTLQKILEISPQLGKDIASAFGIAGNSTEQWINSLGKAGISVNDLLAHVVQFKPHVDAAFDSKGPDTLSQSIDKLKASFMNLLEEVSKEAGFHDFNDLVVSLTHKLDDLAKEPGPLVAGIKEFSDAIHSLISDFQTLIGWGQKVADVLNSINSAAQSAANFIRGGFGIPGVGPSGSGEQYGPPTPLPYTGTPGSVGSLPTVPFGQSDLMQTLRSFFSSINPVGSANAADLVSAVQGGFDRLDGTLQDTNSTLQSGLTHIDGGLTQVGTGFTELGGTVSNGLGQLDTSLQDGFSTDTSAAQNGFQTVATNLTNGFTTVNTGNIPSVIRMGSDANVSGHSGTQAAVNQGASQITSAIGQQSSAFTQAFSSIDNSISSFLGSVSMPGGAGFLNPTNTNAGGGRVITGANNPYPPGSQLWNIWNQQSQWDPNYNIAVYHGGNFLNTGLDVVMQGGGGPDSIYFPMYLSPGERLIVLPSDKAGSLPPTGLPPTPQAGGFSQAASMASAVGGSGASFSAPTGLPGGATGSNYGGLPVYSFGNIAPPGLAGPPALPDRAIPLPIGSPPPSSPAGGGPGLIWKGVGLSGGQWIPANSPYANVNFFAGGVDYTIPGSGAPDSVSMQLHISPGERLIVLPADKVGSVPPLNLPGLSGGAAGGIYAASGLDTGARAPGAGGSDLASVLADLKRTVADFVSRMESQQTPLIGTVNVQAMDARGVSASARQSYSELARQIAAASSRA